MLMNTSNTSDTNTSTKGNPKGRSATSSRPDDDLFNEPKPPG
jgi:hypothetical protein